MVCPYGAYGPSTAEVVTLLALQQQIAALSGSLPIGPAPALVPHMQDPISVSINQMAAGADCQWHVNEVAYVACGKEEAEKTEVPACNVPSLVRLAGKGNLEAVRGLLDGGEDPDIMDDLGLTALHAAAKKGHNKIVALLIARGARVNPCAAKWKGETPLHYACKYGHAKTLQMLLSFGADPSVLTQEGRSCLDLAKEKKHMNCLELLSDAAGQSVTVRV